MIALNNGNNNKNKITPPKTVKVPKKSIIPNLLVAVIWIISLFTAPYLSYPKLGITLVVSLIVYIIAKSKFPTTYVELSEADGKAADEEIKKTGDKIVDEFIDKITNYMGQVHLLNSAIADDEMSSNLYEIEKILGHIAEKIKTEKEKYKRIEKLTQFMNYYIPTMVKIVDSYRKMENKTFAGDNIKETKKRISETMPFIRDAFAAEYDSMFKEEMIDITTDIEVLESMLSQEGLIDKNNIDINKFNKENNK